MEEVPLNMTSQMADLCFYDGPQGTSEIISVVQSRFLAPECLRTNERNCGGIQSTSTGHCDSVIDSRVRAIVKY